MTSNPTDIPGPGGWRFAISTALGLLLCGLGLRYLAFLQLGGGPELAAYGEAMCRLDCLWYGEIATQGYDLTARHDGQVNWAFFPLTPLLIGTIQRLTLLALPLAGMLAGSLAILAATIASWPLFDGQRRAYLLSASWLLLGPGAVYFTTGYSESLFVLFTMLAFVALKRGNPIAAGLAGALLSATRLVGVVLVFAMLADAWLRHRRAGGGVAQFPATVMRNGPLLLGLVLAPLGAFAFMAYLYLQLGDALAFMRAQEGWGRYLDFPWLHLFEALSSLTAAFVIWGATALVGVGLALLLLLRRSLAEGLFCLLALLVPLSAGVLSMPRFILALAPFYVSGGRMLSRSPLAVLAAAVLGTALGYAAAIGWFSDFGYLT